jgi:hypothetical protein
MATIIEPMDIDHKPEPMELDEQQEASEIAVEAVTRERIEEIAIKTTGQTNNSNWFAYRRNRLTGSMFGKALDAYIRPTEVKLLNIKQAVQGRISLDYLEPIKWGKNNEQNAIAAYCNKTGHFVKPTGLWLFPCGQLGASPDGLVYESADSERPVGILEVKCPYYVRDRHFMELKRSGKLPTYITADLHLNRVHDYYHQVQGELYATGADWCDFVMWTTRSCLVIRVYSNPSWATECVPKLLAFYEKVIKVK